MQKYVSAKEAASQLGLKYITLLARVRRGKIKCKRVGWSVLISVTEVERIKQDDHLKTVAKSAGQVLLPLNKEH